MLAFNLLFISFLTTLQTKMCFIYLGACTKLSEVLLTVMNCQNENLSRELLAVGLGATGHVYTSPYGDIVTALYAWHMLKFSHYIAIAVHYKQGVCCYSNISSDHV